MSISGSAVTRMGLGGGMWTPLHTTFPAKAVQLVVGLYNAFAYFATGSSVSIVIYDPVDSSIVATDTGACVEIGATGVFAWSLDNLTTQPAGYKQYAWRMTDGSAFEAGEITHPDPASESRLHPVLFR